MAVDANDRASAMLDMLSGNPSLSAARPDRLQNLHKRRRPDGARIATQLRMLRPGSPARLSACTHLLLRMHVLRRVRRQRALQRMSELRRGLYATADPAIERMAVRALRRQAPSLGKARVPVLHARRHCGPQPSDQGYSASGAMS